MGRGPPACLTSFRGIKPPNVVHGEEEMTGRVSDLDTSYDVRVIKLTQDSRLAQELGNVFAGRGEIRKDGLQGYQSTVALPECEVDDPHPPVSQLAYDLVSDDRLGTNLDASPAGRAQGRYAGVRIPD